VPKVPLAPYAMVGAILNVHMGMAARQLRWLEPIWQDSRATIVLYGWFGSKLVEALPGTRAVYDCIDEHRAADGVEGNPARAGHVWEEEKKLIAAAALSVFVSAPLAEERAPLARRHAVLPNASDVEWCRGSFREPESIASMPRPRALFMGHLTSKIDVDLIRAAAAADTSVSWILAGEALGVAPASMPPNVRALGRLHHDDIAPIAVHCDCGVAPLKATAWNRGSSPMKYGDYLAAGLPIVTTPVPAAEELARSLPEAVVVAEGAAFAAAVRRAALLPATVRDACRSYAAAHTWRDRARAMLDALELPGGTG
jgi:glycosyltransferase involved in cell wall biosynthesis